MSIEITGLTELIEMIDQIGKVPQKVATQSARSGAQIVLSAVKQDAPVYDGWLKAALKLVGEKTNIKGKKVYEITFDRTYNQKLVKYSKDGKRSYYPVSQEYGWKYPNGGYHVGLQYMKNNANSKAMEAEQKIVDVAKNQIDKIIAQYCRDMEVANGRARGSYSRASSGYLNFRTR